MYLSLYKGKWKILYERSSKILKGLYVVTCYFFIYLIEEYKYTL